MEWEGPRYRPDRYREAERHPLTAAVFEEIAAIETNTAAVRLSVVKLGGLLDLIQGAEDAKKAVERRNRSTAA